MSKRTEGLSKRGPIKQGTLREDGFIFTSYYKSRRGETREQWLSPKAYQRARLSSVVVSARKRARENSVPFDIDQDYLEELFPEDGKCPALGISLSWGDRDGRANCPSLDRIEPELGYVRGNVRWLSQMANQIKTNATTAQICAVADYLRKSTADVAHQY